MKRKLFPFLEFNKRRFPELTVRDYLDSEALMFRVNAQAARGMFDVGGTGRVCNALRRLVVCSTEADVKPDPFC